MGANKHSAFANRKRTDISYIVIAFIVGLIAAIMLYPFLYIASISVSNINEAHRVFILPKGFHVDAYRFIFQLRNVQTGYINTVLYTSVGLLINMFMTIMCSYALSRKWLPGRAFFNVLILITMLFGGGLIPWYLLINNVLKFSNTIWAIVLPGAIGTWNMILLRTYFMNSIPVELDESCKMDGAGEFTTLFKIYIPLSMPILVTIGLFYFVGHWNSWFSASIFLDDATKWPIQLVLRNSIATGGASVIASSGINMPPTPADQLPRASHTTLANALTLCVVLPIILIYPFCQKYFVKGIMVGSLKG